MSKHILLTDGYGEHVAVIKDIDERLIFEIQDAIDYAINDHYCIEVDVLVDEDMISRWKDKSTSEITDNIYFKHIDDDGDESEYFIRIERVFIY